MFRPIPDPNPKSPPEPHNPPPPTPWTASPADLAAADTLAGARRKQIKADAPFLFKEFAGDFYRPATP